MNQKNDAYQKILAARKKAYDNLTDGQKTCISEALQAWYMVEASYEALQHPDFEDIVILSRAMSEIRRLFSNGDYHG